ncbi:MAG: DUF4270 family protein [Bacteroidota bacterium]
MKSKYLALIPGTLVISILVLLFSCKKINTATTLGDELIPTVDNISTFETSLDVDVFNDTFSLTPPNVDSLRSRGGDLHFLGNITTDPLFGTSAGTIFTQLKPPGFRFSFGFNNPDSLIGLDSVVLVLKYVNTYGDTTIPQSVNVFEIDQASDFRYDTSYLIRQNNITYSNLLGNGFYTPQYLDDSVHLFEENSSHQLRIKLNDAFGQRLLAYDSTSASGNNAYYSDSVFNTFFKGFAIVPGGTGNALVGIDLASSKLSVYYKYNHGLLDTAVKEFTFTSTSASSNFIQRDYSGSQLAASAGQTTPQDYSFIQTQPGSFSKILVKGLDTLGNYVINLAELIMTQAYNDDVDTKLVPPTYLYLDAYDSAKNLYRAISYDLSPPDPNTGEFISSNSGFGFSGKPFIDGVNTVEQWRFNISRYVQNVVKGTKPVYPLRLYAPYLTSNTFDLGGADYRYVMFINPSIAAGRVRLYGGTQPTNPNRMRLRIIYTKI